MSIDRGGTRAPWNTTQPLKKNKLMPFAATWMQLEHLTLNEVSQKEKDKCQRGALTSGTQSTDAPSPEGKRNRLWSPRGREGVGWTQQMQTTAFRIWSDSEVLPYVQHRELHPLRKRMLAHAQPGHFAAQKLTEPRKPTILKTL